MDSTTPVVVDTDVISFIFKDHQLAPAYQAILAGRSLTVSLITLAEIEYGMEAKNWGIRRRELMGRFLSRFKPLLSNNLLDNSLIRRRMERAQNLNGPLAAWSLTV
jgi:predicted nucleic acid-binding protein